MEINYFNVNTHITLWVKDEVEAGKDDGIH